MAVRTLPHYIPFIPLGCMLMMIIGVGVWVHYTQEALNQIDYAVRVLGPTVSANDLGRAFEAVKATSSTYVIVACVLFGLGLWRKLLVATKDLSGPSPKHLRAYLIANGIAHFAWWLILVWLVVLMMGLAVLSILTWVGYRAARQVQAARGAMAPEYGQEANWVAVTAQERAAAGGDLVLALMLHSGWPAQAVCPATCANLLALQFLSVADPDQACVCDPEVVRLAAAAARAALDAVPGIMVGIWFMYIFGDLLKTSLACDFTHASRDAEGEGETVVAGAVARIQAPGRGYNKL